MDTKYKKIVEDMLAKAQVTINGNNPSDIRVHNDAFYQRVLTEGEIGLGEAYMEGWWDAGSVDELICKILQADLGKKVTLKWSLVFQLLKARLLNRQSKHRAFINGERHYDLGNELFRNMLDRRMNYSCAYWKNAENLDEAQEN